MKMPFYDYECRECGNTFTQQESFGEHDRRRSLKCPDCGGRKTRQLVPAARVQTSKKS
jgi:putative FmdB family regulatory protein